MVSKLPEGWPCAGHGPVHMTAGTPRPITMCSSAITAKPERATTSSVALFDAVSAASAASPAATPSLLPAPYDSMPPS